MDEITAFSPGEAISESIAVHAATRDGGEDGRGFTVGRQHTARYAGTGVPPSRRPAWALSRLYAGRRSGRPPILDRRHRLPRFQRPSGDRNAAPAGARCEWRRELATVGHGRP